MPPFLRFWQVRMEKATFLANIAPLQSGIMVGDDGMRVKLDIPKTEMANALDLLAWCGVALRVTVEPCITGKMQSNGKGKHDMETGPKRKSCWKATETTATDGDSAQDGGQDP